jgi:predicted unusual protein kinase regulating ubiquinone biosynthesis (AarF/ABC1/UbiB family)
MEFDFVEEGVTMNAVANFFDHDAGTSSSTADGSRRMQLPGPPAVGRKVVVPRCYPELSTKRLLVMDYMEGGSLRDSLRSRYQAAQAQPLLLRLPRLFMLRHDTKNKLSTLLQAQGEQIFTLGTFNADPHPGNVFLTKDKTTGKEDGKLGLIDFVRCSSTEVLASNYECQMLTLCPVINLSPRRAARRH